MAGPHSQRAAASDVHADADELARPVAYARDPDAPQAIARPGVRPPRRTWVFVVLLAVALAGVAWLRLVAAR